MSYKTNTFFIPVKYQPVSENHYPQTADGIMAGFEYRFLPLSPGNSRYKCSYKALAARAGITCHLWKISRHCRLTEQPCLKNRKWELSQGNSLSSGSEVTTVDSSTLEVPSWNPESEGRDVRGRNQTSTWNESSAREENSANLLSMSIAGVIIIGLSRRREFDSRGWFVRLSTEAGFAKLKLS